MAVTIDGVGEINGVVLPTTSFGKVLQVVRATDAGTDRSTTSSSYVDASISVTVTPQRSTSIVLLAWTFGAVSIGLGALTNVRAQYQLTDSSNNTISGAQTLTLGYLGNTSLTGASFYIPLTAIGYATPATISAVTYKGRFRALSASTTAYIDNVNVTSQLYAIEVSA
jgi:hypothetical protein